MATGGLDMAQQRAARRRERRIDAECGQKHLGTDSWKVAPVKKGAK